MWEIKCIVGDKKALEVVKLIQPHTLEPPVVVHIDGAKHSNGHAPQEASPSNSIDTLRTFVKKLVKVTAKQAREHLQSHGFSKNGYSYALAQLQKQGTLKKTKEPNTYEVVR